MVYDYEKEKKVMLLAWKKELNKIRKNRKYLKTKGDQKALLQSLPKGIEAQEDRS